MIPKKYNRDYLIARKVRCDREIRNGAGQVIGAGAIAEIREVVRGKGISIKTERCQHCGQSSYIRGVDRSSITLITDGSEDQ